MEAPEAALLACHDPRGDASLAPPVVDRGELFFHDGWRVYALHLESGVPLSGWAQSYPSRNGQYWINAGNNINFAFVPGIPAAGTGYKSRFRNYHDVGHNPVMNGTDHKALVDQWWMDRLAALIAVEAPDRPHSGPSF